MASPVTLHVARNGQTIGQFPMDTAQQCLDSKIILPTDLCWFEGMTEWKPVSEIVVKQAPTQFPPPNNPPPPLNSPPSAVRDNNDGTKKTLIKNLAIACGILCLTCCMCSSFFFGDDTSVESNDLPSAELEYEIVAIEDANYSIYTRKAFRVRIEKQLDSDQLRSVAAMVLEEGKQSNPRIDAAMFYFYLPETEVDGAHTAGLVEWGAGGKWGNESSSLPKSFSVKSDRGAASSLSSDTVSSLNNNVRKQIFQALIQNERKVRAEAEGIFPLDFNQQNEFFEQKRVAFELQIRNVHKLSEKELGLIIQEGVKKNW